MQTIPRPHDADHAARRLSVIGNFEACFVLVGVKGLTDRHELSEAVFCKSIQQRPPRCFDPGHEVLDRGIGGNFRFDAGDCTFQIVCHLQQIRGKARDRVAHRLIAIALRLPTDVFLIG
ncbi:MAG: hypothetical protein P4M05_21655 [Bradyrhizobium sp.]|nr:hypothetical protein [Bradyrhizobium sp.]